VNCRLAVRLLEVKRISFSGSCPQRIVGRGEGAVRSAANSGTLVVRVPLRAPANRARARKSASRPVRPQVRRHPELRKRAVEWQSGSHCLLRTHESRGGPAGRRSLVSARQRARASAAKDRNRAPATSRARAARPEMRAAEASRAAAPRGPPGIPAGLRVPALSARCLSASSGSSSPGEGGNRRAKAGIAVDAPGLAGYRQCKAARNSDHGWSAGVPISATPARRAGAKTKGGLGRLWRQSNHAQYKTL
jgi:hypothetical protein